jgi:uncharacterized C2H2 Zn-finger protein
MSVVLQPDEYEFPFCPGSPELTGEISGTSGPTSSPTGIDGTIYSSQNCGSTTFADDAHSYKQPVEASNDCSSSPSEPLQQMGTPHLNGYIPPMDPSGNHFATTPNGNLAESPESIGDISGTASPSAEVDGTYINQDHGPTNLPVQQSESSQSQSAAQAHSIWTASPKCEFCGKEFHAQKAVTRHIDDTHSEPKGCSETGCKRMIIGKRKLVTHLERVHNIIVPVSKRRVRKPGKKQQIPKDAPLQVQPTSTQASSHQVHDA